MPVGQHEIRQRFGYHPATPLTGHMHDQIRGTFVTMAECLDELLPDGRDKATAFTKLQEAMHWANSAIAMTGPLAPDAPDKANADGRP